VADLMENGPLFSDNVKFTIELTPQSGSEADT
jgi:hypothetical protein